MQRAILAVVRRLRRRLKKRVGSSTPAPGTGGLQPRRQDLDLQQFSDEDVFDLTKFDDWAPAATVSRLSGDLALINDLRLRGFSLKDPGYQVFATALAEYGFSVLGAWMFKGLIFAKCASHPWLRRFLSGCPGGLRVRPGRP